MSGLQEALEKAVEAALAAGELIRNEAYLPGGPRGGDHKAPVDDEADLLIRDRLIAAFPDWSYHGEEVGTHVAADPRTFWLVDPNDGTYSYLKGLRGSAVSIALIRDEVPVLGVVYSPCYPDDNGDLIAWAEGCGPLRRNGRPVTLGALPDTLGARHAVLISQAAEGRPYINLELIAPARYRAISSIAYRLALVAVGEGEAAVSLARPGWLDYAAGHALLRSRGGEVTDQHGQPVRYPRVGNRDVGWVCVGGHPSVCTWLGGRSWKSILQSPEERPELAFPIVQRNPRRPVDTKALSRAQGVMLGQLAGDALGSLVEFEPSHVIRRRYDDGPRDLQDGGCWSTIAGQPTDDSELALALARTLVGNNAFDESNVFPAYRAWFASDPFDVGTTTRAAFSRASHLDGGLNSQSEANGALMRVSPLGIAAFSDVERAVGWAERDAALSHPHPVCREANAVFVRAIAAGLRGASRQEMYRVALEASTPLTREALERAQVAPPADFMRPQGWVKTALQNAFHRLLHAESLEQGVIDTVREGGDTDTNAAIAGALLGAFHGRDGVPARWQRDILTCRPARVCPAVQRPRPSWCWPVDALEIAERLLWLGA